MDDNDFSDFKLGELPSDLMSHRLYDSIDKLTIDLQVSNSTIKSQAKEIESLKAQIAELAEKYNLYKERAIAYRNKSRKLKQDLGCAERMIREMATDPNYKLVKSPHNGTDAEDDDWNDSDSKDH